MVFKTAGFSGGNWIVVETKFNTNPRNSSCCEGLNTDFHGVQPDPESQFRLQNL